MNRVKTGWKEHATAQKTELVKISRKIMIRTIYLVVTSSLVIQWQVEEHLTDLVTVNWRTEKLHETELYREQSNGNWNIKNKTWTNLDISTWSTVDLRAENVALQGCMRIASNTLKPDYPPHQGRELFYMGQDVQSCEKKVFLKSLRTVEILFTSVSLNNTLIVSCLQPRSLAGVKKWTITDCIPLEKLV